MIQSTQKKITLQNAMETLPLVAILRDVRPEEVLTIANVIKTAGFSMIEVPLNSPEPYESIRLLSEAMGNEVLIGAGTVLTQQQVDQVFAVGGRLIVTPNTDTTVIHHAKTKGMYVLPGFYTPSEAFAAISAGADGLKLFPADQGAIEKLKAMTAVLPPIPLLPVGGVNDKNLETFIQVGAQGFGLGSGLYKAGMTAQQVKQNAESYIQAYRKAESNL